MTEPWLDQALMEYTYMLGTVKRQVEISGMYWMPYSNISLSVYQSRYNSLKLYTLLRTNSSDVLKQSSYPTEYYLGLMI